MKELLRHLSNANEQYNYLDNLVQLYNKLQDNQSKEFFWARLRFEFEPNMDTAIQLVELAGKSNSDSIISSNRKKTWREEFAKAAAAGKRIVLYGAGSRGKLQATYLLNSNVDFFAFCDKSRYGDTVCGKPVLPPEEILEHPTSYAIVITTSRYYDEIVSFLQENRFPMESVLSCFETQNRSAYFEFPELFKRGTAFVDAGCYDGADSIQFANGAAACIPRYLLLSRTRPISTAVKSI